MTTANVSPKSPSLSRPVLVSAATAAVVCGAALLGAHYAQALLGGPVESAFAFSGTLTGTTGAQTLTFTFQRGTLSCVVPVSGVTPDATTGAFQVSIPTTGCPAGVLDDPQSTVSVTVGTTVVIPARPIEPVPFARYAERLGTGLCPTGYDVDPSVLAPRHGCARGSDVVVRVGDGSSAFWIDRYEASVWSSIDGTGTRYGASDVGAYPAAFLQNGQWTGLTPPVYAASVVGVLPSVSLTWFQAAAACRASGKRLPNGEEWLAAARATPDGSGCNVTTTAARAAGLDASCESAAGAQDMIGNVWEWTSEWYASADSIGVFSTTTAWPADYGMDGTWGVTSYAYSDSARVQGAPAAALRGGRWADGAQAGVFALYLGSAPSYWTTDVGFRCVVER